jgi:phage I-like protein
LKSIVRLAFDLPSASADMDRITEIVLSPAGDVESEHGPYTLDQDSFDEIYKKFKSVKRDLVIDYEHQTIPKHNTRPDGKAPAAGWIVDLKWDARGLVGLVRWNEQTRREIKRGEYKYLSPVFSIDDDRRVTELHSAAVTNDPAIHGMSPLAASRRITMPKKKTDASPFASRLLGKPLYDRIVAFEDDMGDAIDEGTNGLQEAINSLRTWLINAGKVGADADPMAVLEAAAQALAMKADAPAELVEANKAREQIAEKLALKKDASFTDVIAKVDSVLVERVPATELTALKAKLETLEVSEKKRNADILVESYRNDGKLLDSDTEQMAWANTMAIEQPEAFKSLMDKAPRRFEPATVMNGKITKPGSERLTLIRQAAKEWKDNDKLQKAWTLSNIVNDTLVAHKMPLATKDELAAVEKS